MTENKSHYLKSVQAYYEEFSGKFPCASTLDKNHIKFYQGKDGGISS